MRVGQSSVPPENLGLQTGLFLHRRRDSPFPAAKRRRKNGSGLREGLEQNLSLGITKEGVRVGDWLSFAEWITAMHTFIHTVQESMHRFPTQELARDVPRGGHVCLARSVNPPPPGCPKWRRPAESRHPGAATGEGNGNGRLPVRAGEGTSRLCSKMRDSHLPDG